MNRDSSAIATAPEALSARLAATPATVRSSSGSPAAGLVFGFLGVLAFSFTLPLTRVAVASIDPLVIGGGRAVVAAVLAAAVLAIVRPRRPRADQWFRLGLVGVGVVAGFPLLTSFALQTAPAAHGAVVIGLLPVATAVAAVLRGGERPSTGFWVASIAGALAVVGFVALTSGGLAGVSLSDLLLLGAVVLAAIGYSEGAILSRELGSWQTICWALVVSLPVMAVVAGFGLASGWPEASASAWWSFAYLAGVSMFLGFFAWYRGLAIGPMARVSQIQLAQPVLTIAWSALLLGESLDWPVWVGAAVVLACAITAVRARVKR